MKSLSIRASYWIGFVATMNCVLSALPASAQSPLQNYSDQLSNVVSSLQCSASGSAVTGLPNILGEDEATDFAVSLDDAGTFLVNGRRLSPLDTVMKDGSVSLSMVRLQDFMGALSGIDNSTGSAMGLTDEQSAALGAMMNGFIAQGLGNRQRFAIFDVKNSRVLFADADGKTFKNLQQAQCY